MLLYKPSKLRKRTKHWVLPHVLSAPFFQNSKGDMIVENMQKDEHKRLCERTKIMWGETLGRGIRDHTLPYTAKHTLIAVRAVKKRS